MKQIQFVSCKLVKESNSRYDLDSKKISSPQSVKVIVDKVLNLNECAEEYFYILCLDTKNNVNAISLISKGCLDSTVVHPREVFKTALLNNSASIILVHNHPSGDVEPSNEDKSITNRLIECGKLLGIRVLDHVIVGDYLYSFKEHGLI